MSLPTRERATSAATKGIIHEDGGAHLGTFENDVPMALAMGSHAGTVTVGR